MMSRVAEKMLCEAEGRKKAKGLGRDVAVVTDSETAGVTKVSEATRASGSGLESSFVGTLVGRAGSIDFIGRAYADGVAGVVRLRRREVEGVGELSAESVPGGGGGDEFSQGGGGAAFKPAGG
jgi:hypothetical protein